MISTKYIIIGKYREFKLLVLIVVTEILQGENITHEIFSSREHIYSGSVA